MRFQLRTNFSFSFFRQTPSKIAQFLDNFLRYLNFRSWIHNFWSSTFHPIELTLPVTLEDKKPKKKR